VKDRAFSGKDVADAIRSASETLGLPESRLRYFVLDPGRPATLGVAATPATIAVLMGAPAASEPPPPVSRGGTAAPSGPRPPAPRAEPAPGAFDEDEYEDDEEDPETLEERLARVTQALGKALEQTVEAEILEERDAATLRIRVPDSGFLLGKDADGGPGRALEHLLHRMFAYTVAPRKLRVEFDGMREVREEALRQMTLRLVAALREADGEQQTPPLNAYERRLVHMTAAIAGGVTTQSAGEGAERRVVLRLSPDAGGGGEVF